MSSPIQDKNSTAWWGIINLIHRGVSPLVKLAIMLMVALSLQLLAAGDLASQFLNPPASARPWVYWFWNNGNVTKAGITADLEAMQRAGIGGVIIMDVVERFAPPPGPADFMNPEWQELFRFAVSEAHRLGLEINMTNGPGWCGSSGPWITPALSMQRLIATNFTLVGPLRFSSRLPCPATDSRTQHDGFNSSVAYEDYYRDIAVLAFPETTNGVIAPASVLNLTAQMDTNAVLTWEVPAGHWILQRIGHTTTGSSTRPPVKGGNGLECDKLSRQAMDVHFTNLIGKLVQQVGQLAGPTFAATHIDSWEVGTQNWTPKFREEFQQRRGYDPVPFLPDIIPATPPPGILAASPAYPGTIGDPAMAARFRWDFEQTISELLAQNYVGRLAELAHEHGLRLSLEGYNLPFGDEAAYSEPADEPMTEFWATGGNENQAKGRQMASVAHIMGRTIVGAEAFTSGDNEQWKMHPSTVKALGDYEFCQGINRFVIHRYAHQPYLDRFPGVTMGPWGLHYERTQTWWEMSSAWHEYLARCQFMLRQGRFVADICCLRPQLPDQTYFSPEPAVPPGYKFDECSAGALINRMTVKDGRLVLPDGMSYRLLVLPANPKLMTPALVRKIKALVSGGATVVGPPPTGSPSLSGFPDCDREVASLAAEVWGNIDGETVTEHSYGRGRVFWGKPLPSVLEQLATPPDFTSTVKLHWIHRQIGDVPVYFVANEQPLAVEALCTFRVKGLRPELWNPETGEMTPLAVYRATSEGTSLPLHLEGSGSVFLVFREPPKNFDSIAALTRNGAPVISPTQAPTVIIQKATYGVPGDAARTREVHAKVQSLVSAGEMRFQVAQLAAGDDPAYGVVKTLVVDYTIDGQPRSLNGQDPDIVSFVMPVGATERAAEVRSDSVGRVCLAASQPGDYELQRASGKVLKISVTEVPPPLVIGGPWQVSFPPRWGAPDHITMDHLASLSESTDAGVKFFSGTANYRTDFDWQQPARTGAQPAEYWLDLGDVQVMAAVTLNGHNLGILWQPPFRVMVTGVLRSGRNKLEIRVADLWPNRMIGDAALPLADRFTWSTYEPFTKDTPLLKSGLLGPVILQGTQINLLP